MMAGDKIMDFPGLDLLLNGLVAGVTVADIPVAAIRLDSREVEQGDLFIAINGARLQGTEFIPDAINRGAVAVLVDAGVEIEPAAFQVPVYPITDLRLNTGLIASRFYDDPSASLNITGITGTNGKTSVAYYLAQAFSDSEKYPVGSIGTLGYGIYDNLVPGTHTTPDPVTVQGLLADFLSKGISEVVMEVSSHALEQGRVNGVRFTTAVFTNLSREHLDYHPDIATYAGVKKKLFAVPDLRNAVINIDDELGQELATELDGKLNLVTYGLVDKPLSGNRLQPTLTGFIKQEQINSLLLEVITPWGKGQFSVPLTGRFNACNILACLGVLCLQGVPFETALQRLSNIKGVPGRLELFGNEGSAKIFVDYAHTPDALQQALISLRPLCAGTLVCVFGCGGDRDKGKRPEMGKVADEYADRIILTSDNPRNEPPEQIISEIYSGIQDGTSVEIQSDRTLAIRHALESTGPDDIVLIAGKGHETWQEIRTNKIPFSDRQLVRNLLEDRR